VWDRAPASSNLNPLTHSDLSTTYRFYNGLYKSFRPLPEGGSGNCWYLCDFSFSSDSKMEKQSLECTERNRIIPERAPTLSWD
jgi:hypothetical protein